MKKALVLVFFSIFLLSCSESISRLGTFCKNEQALLSDTSASVLYDFLLDEENQFLSFQKQTDFDLCNRFERLNGIFQIEGQDVEVSIVSEGYCKESNTEMPIIHRSNFVGILINKKGEVLIDYEKVHFDSVPREVVKYLHYYLIKDGFRNTVYFNLTWLEETPLNLRKQVFVSVLRGYLQFVNGLAMDNFNKEICELEPRQLIWLKENFQMAFWNSRMVLLDVEDIDILEKMSRELDSIDSD